MSILPMGSGGPTVADFYGLLNVSDTRYQFGDVEERVPISQQQYESWVEAVSGVPYAVYEAVQSGTPLVPRYTENPNPEKNFTSITDWKNHQVVTGDVYEIFLDVPWLVQQMLKGTTSIVTTALSWMNVYKFNPKGLFISLINKALNTATSIGLMKDKVAIDFDNSGFTQDHSVMIVRAVILENSWPLYILIGVISLGAVFAVREVRLIYRGYPGKKADVLSGGLLLLVASVLVFFFILRK